jgi:hypothetical protein
MRLLQRVEVRSNLIITARERGKIVARRAGHNIWVNLGREFLSGLIALDSTDPDVPARDDRIKFMGFGIGGTRQHQLAVANSPPLSVAYPGPNSQTDTEPNVTHLERPIRLSGTTTGPSDPYDPADRWLGRVQAPAVRSTPTEVSFRRLFSQTEISYSTFTSVPLSEAGLFTSAASPTGQPFSPLVAYDTFDSLSKTSAFEVEVVWTVRF